MAKTIQVKLIYQNLMDKNKLEFKGLGIYDSMSEMFRLPRLVILEIISREGSSLMSEGFLEFIRMLNSMSFKELKENKSIVHILQNNTSLFSFKTITLAMDSHMADSHLTASSQLAVVG